MRAPTLRMRFCKIRENSSTDLLSMLSKKCVNQETYYSAGIWKIYIHVFVHTRTHTRTHTLSASRVPSATNHHKRSGLKQRLSVPSQLGGSAARYPGVGHVHSFRRLRGRILSRTVPASGGRGPALACGRVSSASASLCHTAIRSGSARRVSGFFYTRTGPWISGSPRHPPPGRTCKDPTS